MSPRGFVQTGLLLPGRTGNPGDSWVNLDEQASSSSTVSWAASSSAAGPMAEAAATRAEQHLTAAAAAGVSKQPRPAVAASSKHIIRASGQASWAALTSGCLRAAFSRPGRLSDGAGAWAGRTSGRPGRSQIAPLARVGRGALASTALPALVLGCGWQLLAGMLMAAACSAMLIRHEPQLLWPEHWLWLKWLGWP